MASEQPRAVTLSDLSMLTLRANVAFAVRCAQRLRPCFELPIDAPHRIEQIAAVDAAIGVATAFCQGVPAQPGRAAEAVLAAAVVAEETCDFTRFAGYGAVRAAEAAANAEAFVNHQDESSSMEVVAAAFGAGRVLAANADLFTLDVVVHALHVDLENLLVLARGINQDLGLPVDASESGPLGPYWPAGVPACFAPNAQPAD